MDVSSPADIAALLIGAQASAQQQSANIAVLKQQQKADQALLAMLDQATTSAPLSAGQGQKLDVKA
jgi:hypothetical protein